MVESDSVSYIIVVASLSFYYYVVQKASGKWLPESGKKIADPVLLLSLPHFSAGVFASGPRKNPVSCSEIIFSASLWKTNIGQKSQRLQMIYEALNSTIKTLGPGQIFFS